MIINELCLRKQTIVQDEWFEVVCYCFLLLFTVIEISLASHLLFLRGTLIILFCHEMMKSAKCLFRLLCFANLRLIDTHKKTTTVLKYLTRIFHSISKQLLVLNKLSLFFSLCLCE